LKPFVTVAVPPSGFVTVTFPVAPIPPDPVTLMVIEVDEFQVTELTLPLTLIVTRTPGAKFVPVIVQFVVPLWLGSHGLVPVGEVTVGTDFVTLKELLTTVPCAGLLVACSL
jgi:hypothetical protein